MKEYIVAKLLIEAGADVMYFGRQPNNSFGVILKRKVKSLLTVLKQYYSAKKFKEFELKFKNLKEEFVDFRQTVEKNQKEISEVTVIIKTNPPVLAEEKFLDSNKSSKKTTSQKFFSKKVDNFAYLGSIQSLNSEISEMQLVF